MKKFAFILSVLYLLPLPILAQSISKTGSQKKESFQEFRNRIHNNYNQFRQTILDHYADFLNGEWHEYESHNGLKRDVTPKPEEAPYVGLPNLTEFPSKPSIKEKEPLSNSKPEVKPEPTSAPKPETKPESTSAPKPEVKPESTSAPKPEAKPEPTSAPKPETKPEPTSVPKPEVKPEPTSAPKPEAKPEPTSVPKPEVKPEPTSAPKPETKPEPTSVPEPEVIPEPTSAPKPEVIPESTSVDDSHKHKHPSLPSVNTNNLQFTFYDIPMEIYDIDFKIANNLANPSDFANQWKNLEANKVGEKLLPSIKKEIQKIGLNDYLTYKYLESYVKAKFPKDSDSSRMALVHYLLTHLGYDARIAVTTKGTPLLLIPFKQTVYGKPYLQLQNNKYYLFPPEGKNVSHVIQEKVMTCQLPSGIDTGNKFDLILGELNIPEKPKAFDLEYGPLHLSGEMNENLIPILYRYPQMPIEDYAKSNIQPGLRRQLTQQVKDQLGNMDGDEDVEALLRFTQNAFQYATDDNYHGFEKPYFIEETLFYPKNDCEDRAIFYTYFLHNALGRETQLVSFPGHEAATVTLKNPINGVYYQYNGKKFYISDPTYIGASSGMVMPSYFNITPEVDYTY